MKKKIAVTLALILALCISACSNSDDKNGAQELEFEKLKLKDGIYYAEDDSFDEGFRENVEITIEGGKITKLVWDGKSEKDLTTSKKDASKSGQYDMKKVGARWDWHEQAEVMEKYVIENGGISNLVFADDLGHVDSITGVSIKVKIFKKLVYKALSQAVQE